MTWLTLLFACATNVTVPDTQTALYDGPPQTVPTVGTATPTGSGTTTTGGTTVTTGGSIGLPFAVDNHLPWRARFCYYRDSRQFADLIGPRPSSTSVTVYKTSKLT